MRSDADKDGVVDSVDGTSGFGDDDRGIGPKMSDSDDAPDYRDTDSDGDGLRDIEEAGLGGLDAEDDGMIDGSDEVDGDGVLDYVIDELHSSSNKPLLPCHPRDLLGLAVDRAVYSGEPRLVKKEHMEWAWKNYFVSMKHVDGVEAQSGEPVVKGD